MEILNKGTQRIHPSGENSSDRSNTIRMLFQTQNGNIYMANRMREKAVVELPNTCVIGSMAHYITHASERYFQPMNANFGIMRLLEKVKKKERKEAFANQALSVIDTYKKEFD